MSNVDRRGFLNLAGSAGLGGLALGSRAARAGAPASRPNVLFLSVDDLRPQLGCYGDRAVKTPNIDGIAASGLLFGRCYCQQALCSPSRISLMTGRSPATTQIFTIGPELRTTMPDVVTLPQQFKQNGYFTRSFGKVYHVGIDDEASWTVPAWHSQKPRHGPEGQEIVRKRREALKAAGKPLSPKNAAERPYGPGFEAVDCGDDDLLDGDTAREAGAVLRERAAHPDQPFFLGVGFSNPHLPYVSPKKYWDLYRTDDMVLPENRFPPKDAPPFAAQSGADFHAYYGAPAVGTQPTPEYARRLIHGYLAAISYVDAQIGRVLEILKQTGLDKNTIVLFWGDNGYMLGEHGWWGGKHNNYETATRVPLIVSVPGQANAGARTEALTEFVDIYPALVDLCGLPTPEGLEGTSFRPLLDNPKRPWKKAAFSWYPKGGRLGTAMRTDRYRYVEWVGKKGDLDAVELYDHANDPQENVNVAGRPENQALLKELHKQREAGWRGAVPVA